MWRPLRTPQELPELPHPNLHRQTVVPTESAMRWDAAVHRGNVPLRAPSLVSSGASSARAPSLRAASISSSADRRRELLFERQAELQAQLTLVEQMLKQAAPSSQFTVVSQAESAVSQQSAVTRASSRSRGSGASIRSGGSSVYRAAHLGDPPKESRAPQPPPTADSERSHRSGRSGRSHSSSRAGSQTSRSGRTPRAAQSLRPIPEGGGEANGGAGRGGVVPLCLDPREQQGITPFRSVVGAGMALPGTQLSRVGA